MIIQRLNLRTFKLPHDVQCDKITKCKLENCLTKHKIIDDDYD